MISEASLVSQAIKGKIDLLSAGFLVAFITSEAYLSTWKDSFPIEYNFFLLLWGLAIGGIVAHMLFWSVEREWVSTYVESRKAIMLFGAGFATLIFMQSAVIVGYEKAVQPAKGISMSVIPVSILYSASGVAEEFLFAFCIFSLLLFALKSLGVAGVILAMLGDGTAFMSYHLAVKTVYYPNTPTFLPAIFIGRFVLDGIYVLSGGRISVTIAIHSLVNFMTTVVGYTVFVYCIGLIH